MQGRRLPNPVTARHINIKRRMAEAQSLKRKAGLGEVVAMAGLEFEGVAHRGIDDARNIAKLWPYVFSELRLPRPGARNDRR
ncbi:MAG: hypothetical protein LBL59_03010 [Xanthomonadaceae bacterium]|jgi:inhibitor of KinA sporulation pathway (predicted exonuclease)|nr:hypothetical protein [Xanthomonadaceae bacterium]